MNQTDLTIIGLLIFIAAQTTYTTYSTRRSGERSANTDVFVDTSVLMDGRIVPIAQAGFIPGRLVIPRSVIGELQLLADKGDSEKRERARRGLDVVRELQSIEAVTVELLQDGSSAREGVDERLLSHAKQSGGMLCTIDFNLNKVAVVEGIRVLNVNELARGLRMSYLPGDRLSLELTTTGTDSHQAVGHLGDGTMVVVEHAKSLIGTTVDIVVIRSLQTAAGRMMFARLEQSAQPTRTKQLSRKSDSTTSKVRKLHKQSSGRPKTADRPSDDSPSNGHTAGNAASAKQPRKLTQPPQTSNTKRIKTSKQREASFINLVNRQDSNG